MKLQLLEKHSSFDDKNSNFDFHIWNYLETPFHTHKDYYELFLVTKGPIKYYVNGKMVLLKSKDMSIVRPSDKHKFFHMQDDTACQHINLAIDCEYFNYFANLINPTLKDTVNSIEGHIIVSVSDEQFNYFNYLKRVINTIPSDETQQRNVNYNLLLFNMLSIFNMSTCIKNEPYPTWFSSLLNEISKPYFIDKTVNDMYALCPYSSPVIVKAFKDHLNTTPIKYLTNLKMTYAKNLLMATDYNTLDICTRIGYASLSHFNHVFKEFYGITPSQYRKRSKIIISD